MTTNREMWRPPRPELEVPYDPRERELDEARPMSRLRWPRAVAIA